MSAPAAVLFVQDGILDATNTIAALGPLAFTISGADDNLGPYDVQVESQLFAVNGGATVLTFQTPTLEFLGPLGDFSFDVKSLLPTLQGHFDFKVTVTNSIGETTVLDQPVNIGYATTVGPDLLYVPQGATVALDPSYLVGNDSLPGWLSSYLPTLNLRGLTGPSGFSYSDVDGTLSVDPSFSGELHLKETIGILDWVSTGVGDLTVKVKALGADGTYGYVHGTDAAETYLYGGATNPVLIAAGGGNDRIIASQGGGSYNGEAGNDFIFGGAGRDGLTGGPGADDIFGGAGADSFIIRKGDLSPGDRIEDFEGAGNGWRPNEDMILFQGFSPSAHLVHVAGSTTYTVVDGTYQASFELFSVNGHDLVKGDYGFYA